MYRYDIIGKRLYGICEKFNAIPYADRINRIATLADIRRGHVEECLRDSNSS